MWQLNNLRLGKSLSSSGSGVTAGNPSLNLNFLGTSTLNPLVTFARASSGTYFDSTGTLQTAGNNAARFDYNPSTLASRGLLIEEQRTNSIRNNTMVGAVAGTPGTSPTNWSRSVSPTSGISSEIAGTGTENGITYIDIRFTGTCTANVSFSVVFETGSGISAAPSEAWTSSAYIKLQAGSLNGSTYQIFINEYNSTPAFLRNTFSSTITPTTANLATQRNAFTITTGASTAYVQPVVAPGFNSGLTYDFTLRIGMPQCEKGAFATSVISTTTAAATRSADVASVNTLSPWYNASAGTLFAEMQMLNTPITPVAIPFSLTGTNSSITLRMRPNGKAGATVIDNSSTVVDTSSTGNYTTGVSKLAFGYALNDFASTLNGEAVVADTSGTIPTITSANVGSFAGSSYLNGYLRRITYYPRRLSNTALQSLTA